MTLLSMIDGWARHNAVSSLVLIAVWGILYVSRVCGVCEWRTDSGFLRA